MAKKPAISVVIPAYNEEKCLPSCLSALRKQTFGDFEIIVVDNNSKDKTSEIARKYGACVVSEKRQGMVYARERGFKAAKADIIARTDADTIIPPDWLETIYRAFAKNPEIVAVTGPLLSSSTKIPNRIMNLYSFLVSVRLGKLVSGQPHLVGPNMGIRKSAWKKTRVHTDDKIVHEDIDLSMQLSKLGKILYLPRLKVTFSFRWVEKDPVKGLIRYLGEYPLRYVKTLSVNDKRLIKFKKKQKQLKKYLRNLRESC